MGALPWDLLFWGAMLLGGVAFIWGVATDDGSPESRQEQQLQKRLARYPASAGAVVIKAQRKRALKRMLPVVLLALPLMLTVQFFRTHTANTWLCDHIGAEQIVRWLTRMFFPGLPAVLAVAAAFAMLWAVRVLRGGYVPPLDSVVFHDTIAVTGWRAKLQAWATLTVMPLMVVVLFHVTHGLAQTFDTDANWRTLGAVKCPKFFPNKAALP